MQTLIPWYYIKFYFYFYFFFWKQLKYFNMRSALRSTEIAHSISIFTFVCGNLWISAQTYKRLQICTQFQMENTTITEMEFSTTIYKWLLLLLLFWYFDYMSGFSAVLPATIVCFFGFIATPRAATATKM